MPQPQKVHFKKKRARKLKKKQFFFHFTTTFYNFETSLAKRVVKLIWKLEMPMIIVFDWFTCYYILFRYLFIKNMENMQCKTSHLVG